ncbi:transposase [Streptomyces griseochromogenes]
MHQRLRSSVHEQPSGGRWFSPARACADDCGDRLRTSRRHAMCGVSPMEYSSGGRSSRRLNHGGDRQANAALHRIVFTRLRVDPRTQAYYARRTQEGKTRREIIRCLKRNAARKVFNLVGTASTDPPL